MAPARALEEGLVQTSGRRAEPRRVRLRIRRRRLVSVAGAVFLASSVMVLQPVGLAASANVSTDAPADCQSATYSYTDAVQQCVVPAGVGRIGVVAVGGQGGETTDKVVGGLGGLTTATIAVTPGEVLSIYVGGYGAEHGGFGGVRGGDHGDAPYIYAYDGAGGGGSSDVRNASGEPLVVAGGGGGAGGGSQLTFSGGSGGQGGIGGVYFGPTDGFAAPGANASGYENSGGQGGCGGCATEAGKGGASTFSDGAGGGGGGGGGYPRSGQGGEPGGVEVEAEADGGGGGGGGGGMSFAVETASDVSYGTATTTGHGSITLTLSPPGSAAPRGPLAAPEPVGDPVVFSTPGEAQWQVPADVTAVNVTVIGAAGGADDHRPGARGDEIKATLKVEPGSLMTVIVGAQGGGPGGGPGHGYTPGGNNGSTCGDCDGDDGSGGGGSTSVSDASKLLIVAGGGGGSGGDADEGGSDGAAGGSGGISPQPGFASFDPNSESLFGYGGGGGSHDSGSGGDGHDCEDPNSGAGGGGGGGYFLTHMGGGGGGGQSGACQDSPSPDPVPGGPELDDPEPGAPVIGGGGAGGGGGRSYIDPGARSVILGGPHTAPGNGSVSITPVRGGTLTVYTGANQTIYPDSLLEAVGVQATDIFGDPIPNLPITMTAPPNTLDFGTNDPTCRVKEHPVCTIVTDDYGSARIQPSTVDLPWAPGPFVITVTSPGFPPTEVTGLVAALLPTTTVVTASTPTGQSSLGQSVVFRAQVTSEQLWPPTSPYQIRTGTVAMSIDGVPIPGSPFPLDATATATTPPLTDLTLGSHVVTASYSGDSAHQVFLPSTASVTQIVREVGSFVAVSSSSNPVTPDGSVTFTATVTTTAPDVAPTGTVQFAINGTAVGEPIPLPAITPFTVSTKALQLPDPLLTPGTHEVTATYSGDDTVDSSLGTLTQMVTTTAPMTLQTCFIRAGSVPDCAGAAVRGMSLLATFVADGPAPTGTVHFLVNGTPFGDPVPLVTGNPNVATAASTPLDQMSGPVSFEARYSGDDVYAPRTLDLSGPIYAFRPVITVTSTVPIISPISNPTTFTVTVAGPDQPVSTSGTVMFYNANVNRAFSGALPLTKQTVVLADQGSCQIGSGEVLVRVDYSGDPGYVLAPGSGTVSQTVLSACFDSASPTTPDEPPTDAGPADTGSHLRPPTFLADTGSDSQPPTFLAAIALLAGMAFIVVGSLARSRRGARNVPAHLRDSGPRLP